LGVNLLVALDDEQWIPSTLQTPYIFKVFDFFLTKNIRDSSADFSSLLVVQRNEQSPNKMELLQQNKQLNVLGDPYKTNLCCETKQICVEVTS
jgi:hypothetical protein